MEDKLARIATYKLRLAGPKECNSAVVTLPPAFRAMNDLKEGDWLDLFLIDPYTLVIRKSEEKRG
jgi:antitoxin component of MazEF toxin-antitoxin module